MVSMVGEFHKANVGKYRNANSQMVKSLDNISNIDYINLFIKQIDLKSKSNGAEKVIVMSDYKVRDIEDIMSVFPQDVLYSEDGVL